MPASCGYPLQVVTSVKFEGYLISRESHLCKVQVFEYLVFTLSLCCVSIFGNLIPSPYVFKNLLGASLQ